MEQIRSNTLRRINGRKVQVEAEYDGVQRAEWLSDGEGGSFGSLFTGRWTRIVTAIRADGEHKTFNIVNKASSLTAARVWLTA